MHTRGDRRWYFWAVEMGWLKGEDRFLAGIGFFGWPHPETPGIDGPRTALFKSRQAARDAIKVKKLGQYQARPVRVVCSVRKVEP